MTTTISPHEALVMRVPADSYERSRRRYPTKLIDCRDATLVEDERYRLDKQGRLTRRRRKILFTSALSYEYVLVERGSDS